MTINRIENRWYWGTAVYFMTSDGSGMVMCCFNDETKDNCALYDLIVHPSCRQHEYATDLMKAAEQEARDRGCLRLTLFTEKDSWIQDWYHRLGFVINEYTRPPHESTVWMCKKLK